MSGVQNDFAENMRSGVFWITRCIAQGAYPDEDRVEALFSKGITHILNVGDSPFDERILRRGFMDTRWEPFEDLIRIPDTTALRCINSVFEMLKSPNSRVYIHCVAGQNRSPTILWLFYVACGIQPHDAKRLIEDRTLDAVAGHPKLIDEKLVSLVQAHGRCHFQPLKRPEIIEPI